MRKWLLLAAIFTVGGALVVPDADAGRLGGGRSMGAQRSITAPPSRPAPQQAQQAAPQKGTAQQPAAAPAQGSRWGGILGGLALGGLLGYLFGGSGLLGILVIAALAIMAVMVVRALMSRRRAESVQHVQYAGMRESVSMPAQMESSASKPAMSGGAPVPAGFDAAGFLRAAKLNFLKLQAASDAGKLDEIREFTTDELYEELRKDFGRNAGETAHATDIAALDADLLEFATEGDRHWASVRFSGTVREAPRREPEAFTEVWNLVKPTNGSTGWLLAGIQQMH